MVAMGFMNIVLSRASLDRIVEILDEKIDIEDAPDSQDIEVKDGSIDFDNVDFSYSKSRDVLNLENIDLHIRSGETIGIIGGTGSAKSTLVQLIPRLYDVLDGEVKVGGVNVKDYKLDKLRDSVAMVLQKNVLFSGTIRQNLLWGNKDATDEEIEHAAKAAQAHDFIMSFPDGYETELGQGGVNVSGGQKQRLCIARALLKKPKIMIMDDSTSAVDTATDAAIRSGLKKEFGDTTVLIIAQRISSVEDADRIIVMNDGKIDAVIVDLEPAKNIVAANPKLKILENTDYEPEDYAIAVKKGNTELLGLIDVVLTEIKADGTYDNLVKGFIDTPQDERGDYITGEQVGTEGTLTVGTNAEFPPFEYTLDDGSIVGFDIEIAKLIAKKANKTLVVKNTLFDSLLMELDSGSVDFVIAGMTVDEERSAQVDFSQSYYTSEQAVIIRAE